MQSWKSVSGIKPKAASEAIFVLSSFLSSLLQTGCINTKIELSIAKEILALIQLGTSYTALSFQWLSVLLNFCETYDICM